ncbi:hypothetical protein K488DRAFT_85283 [Vararia minispora EC-137]|uniref:Uncharacterized protein n=1 Tax=Vararia minispora EC-137 TaxID=1314806 RepID=A0ACB8QNJ3_9AGAM|nr:hypothetical protein K488DRAFT_85283 [Vararia minispora EC-137]
MRMERQYYAGPLAQRWNELAGDRMTALASTIYLECAKNATARYSMMSIGHGSHTVKVRAVDLPAENARMITTTSKITYDAAILVNGDTAHVVTRAMKGARKESIIAVNEDDTIEDKIQITECASRWQLRFTLFCDGHQVVVRGLRI